MIRTGVCCIAVLAAVNVMYLALGLIVRINSLIYYINVYLSYYLIIELNYVFH